MTCDVSRYYLSRAGECYQFPWGGCGGNDNNFPSRSLCLATCQPRPSCDLQPEAGPCRERLSRYYYDGQDCQLWVSLSPLALLTC